MELSIDEVADALHLQLVNDSVVESEEVVPGVIVDYDVDWEIIGSFAFDQAATPCGFNGFNGFSVSSQSKKSGNFQSIVIVNEIVLKPSRVRIAYLYRAWDGVWKMVRDAYETVKVLRIWSTNLGLYSGTQLKISNLKNKKKFKVGFYNTFTVSYPI
jgi:hypothetical protein